MLHIGHNVANVECDAMAGTSCAIMIMCTMYVPVGLQLATGRCPTLGQPVRAWALSGTEWHCRGEPL